MGVKQFGQIMAEEGWVVLPEGPEKYQAYLCSRQWAERRNAVYKRCGCVCERCGVNGADNVHHLTYARKYQELPEDLQALCRGCHEFIHGKSNIDPRPRQKLYLAGKVSKSCWRHQLVSGLRGATWENAPLQKAVSIAGEDFDYAGPFFVSCNHGCYHTKDSHGIVSHNDCSGWLERMGSAKHGSVWTGKARIDITWWCRCAIKRSDLVFAWINDPTCYGTLIEIGYAAALMIPTYIGFSSEDLKREMWFVDVVSSASIVADDPRSAIEGIVQLVNNRNTSCTTSPQ